MNFPRYCLAVRSKNAARQALNLFTFCLLATFVPTESISADTACTETSPAQGEHVLFQAARRLARPDHNKTVQKQSNKLLQEAVEAMNKSVNKLLQETVEAEHGVNPSGAAAPLSDEGYAAVADRCCQVEMMQFIERQVIELGYTVCLPGGLHGITPYHSCEKGPQDFGKLTSDLLRDSSDRCTWLAYTGMCSGMPDDCPSYANVEPKRDCACSRSEAAKIDLASAEVSQNNLGGLGPSEGAEELRFANAGTSEDGQDFDLVVTAIGSYSSKHPIRNGLHHGFGAIHFSGAAELRFSFMKPGTDSPLELTEVHVSLSALEEIQSAGGIAFDSRTGYKGYITDVLSDLETFRLSSGRTKFTSDGKHTAPYPEDPMRLTELQRKNSVMYFFSQVSSFELALSVVDAASDSGRYIFFAGHSSLNDRCGK
jgi:hypothetical protein